MTPLDRILHALEQAGCNPRQAGQNKWTAWCPVHELDGRSHKPSLSVGQGADGRALVHCFVGCPTERIMAALGLPMAALMPAGGSRPAARKKPAGGRKPADDPRPTGRLYLTAKVALQALRAKHGAESATWAYANKEGAIVGLVVRWDTPDGKLVKPISLHPDGWRHAAMPEPRPLYRLPEILTAAGEQPIFVAEGEKAADALVRCGLRGTTSAGGANAAAKSDWAPLAGRRVVVLPDNDNAGERYATDVARCCRAAGAADVRILRLAEHAPELPAGGDIADVLESSTWCGIGLGDAATPEDLGHLVRRLAEAAPQAQPDKARLARLFDMKPEPVGWLWPGRIPLGRLSLLAGMPGVGKSWLVLDAAARISTGTPWPDGLPCPQGSVLLLAAEDDLRDTIRPRLDAMHADTRRVYAFTAVRRVEGGKAYEASVRLWDIDAIEEAIAWLHDCRLVAIDPIGSYLGSQTDGNAESQVRAVLEPLADLARKHNVAIVMVAHRRKMRAYIADDYVLGSRAFTGLARATWHVTRDPNDSSKLRRLFLPGKNNLATTTSGLAFSIYGEPPQVVWERNPVNITADDALAQENNAGKKSKPGPEPEARSQAAEWLRDLLKTGPLEAGKIREEGEAAGYAWRTLHRAKEELGIRPYRERFGGNWIWKLPDGPAALSCHVPQEQGNLASWHDSKNPGKNGGSKPGTLLSCQDDLSWHDSEKPDAEGELVKRGYIRPKELPEQGAESPGRLPDEDREQFVV